MESAALLSNLDLVIAVDTSIVHLARVLTPENRREMIPKFFQRSKREALRATA